MSSTVLVAFSASSHASSNSHDCAVGEMMFSFSRCETKNNPQEMGSEPVHPGIDRDLKPDFRDSKAYVFCTSLGFILAA